MKRIMLIDDKGTVTYFNSFSDAARFLGVSPEEVETAYEEGTEIVDHVVDELII